METVTLTLLILLLALGTYLMRLLPLTVLSRMTLPRPVLDWLSLVPGAVLAASLAQALLVRDERIVLAWDNIYLLATLPTFLVAWRTRSVLLTMLAGMAAYALLQRLI
jgi:branched-subunit amino acid transport protein